MSDLWIAHQQINSERVLDTHVSLPTSSDRILAKFLANQKGGVEAFELREEIIFLSKVCLNTYT